MENTVVSVGCIGGQLGTSFFTPSTDFLFTAHCTVAEQCSREYAETRVLPPENLALSWLSHSASILTHLNESVSRSSVGGGLPYPSFLFCAHQQLLQYKYSYQETKTHNLCLQSFWRGQNTNPPLIPICICSVLSVKNLKHLSSTLVLTHGSILTHLNETVSREMASCVQSVFTFVFLCLDVYTVKRVQLLSVFETDIVLVDITVQGVRKNKTIGRAPIFKEGYICEFFRQT